MTAAFDRPKDPREPDASTIDLAQSWQCRWWAEHFGVTRAQLLAAILEVGVDVDAVKQALGGIRADSSDACC